MTLIVEDGTIISGANTYSSLASLRAYALLQGVTLSAVDADLEADAIKAMLFIDGHRASFLGDKMTYEQLTQWPRTGAVIDGFVLLDTTMPPELASVQAELCMQLEAGVDIAPVGTVTINGAVKREKVGPIDTEYDTSEVGGGPAVPDMPTVDALLAPLLHSRTSATVTRA